MNEEILKRLIEKYPDHKFEIKDNDLIVNDNNIGLKVFFIALNELEKEDLKMIELELELIMKIFHSVEIFLKK